MRKLVPLLFVAVALVATGAALSSGSPNERLASQTRIYGGGTFGPACVSEPFQFCLPNERSFAIDAHVEGHGNGAAYGTWEYGPTNGPWHVRGDITCVTVVGNAAIAGGYVTESERPELVGLAFAAYERDSGTPASHMRDQASIGWFGTSDGLPGDFPTSFPQQCPASGSFDAATAPPVWFDVNGDVVIQR